MSYNFFGGDSLRFRNVECAAHLSWMSSEFYGCLDVDESWGDYNRPQTTAQFPHGSSHLASVPTSTESGELQSCTRGKIITCEPELQGAGKEHRGSSKRYCRCSCLISCLTQASTQLTLTET